MKSIDILSLGRYYKIKLDDNNHHKLPDCLTIQDYYTLSYHR